MAIEYWSDGAWAKLADTDNRGTYTWQLPSDTTASALTMRITATQEHAVTHTTQFRVLH